MDSTDNQVANHPLDSEEQLINEIAQVLILISKDIIKNNKEIKCKNYENHTHLSN